MTVNQALRLVAGYIFHPVENWEKDTTEDEREKLKTAGLIAYENQARHQCYWNNRFCIAVMCSLDLELQRQAAWCIVNNALIGYWEWYTHSGYPMHYALRHTKIPNLDMPMTRENGYALISRSEPFLQKIVLHFKLPTAYFDHRSLTLEEQSERAMWNAKYAESLIGSAKSPRL